MKSTLLHPTPILTAVVILLLVFPFLGTEENVHRLMAAPIMLSFGLMCFVLFNMATIIKDVTKFSTSRSNIDEYARGMKDLSNCSFALAGALGLLPTYVWLSAFAGHPFKFSPEVAEASMAFLIVLPIMACFYAAFGMLARFQWWIVNVLVAIWSSLLLCLNVWGALSESSGIVLAPVLLQIYFLARSVKNIGLLRQARATGFPSCP